jgi:hypothetical protein
LKIKFIFILLFLLVILPGCFPDIPEQGSGNRSRRYFSKEDSPGSGSTSERESIRAAHAEKITKGQRIVDVNIQYLKELKKNNERVIQEREAGGEININEVRKRQLQKEAKDRHFEKLKSLLDF